MVFTTYCLFIDLEKSWAGTRKKEPFDFPVYVSSNAHAQSPIWATDSFFAWSFLKVSTISLRTAKALARLRLRAGSPEPLMVAYVVNSFSHVLTKVRFTILKWWLNAGRVRRHFGFNLQYVLRYKMAPDLPKHCDTFNPYHTFLKIWTMNS